MRRSGFTLIEILVTVVIVTTAAMFLLPGLAMSSKIQQVAEGQSAVYLFAVSKLAELELSASAAESAEDFPSTGQGYINRKSRLAKWLVQTIPFLEDTEIKQVQCDFSWPGRGAGEHYQLLTVFGFDAEE